MSLAIVHSRALSGIDAKPVTIEVHIQNGLPGLAMVGLPATGVKEAKERVRSAIKNSQFEFPVKRITVNLAPADLPKEGGRYDLGIALGILAASDQIAAEELLAYEFFAELALSGHLRAVSGALPAVYAGLQAGRQTILALGNQQEASLVREATVFCASSLTEVVAHLQKTAELNAIEKNNPVIYQSYPDMADIRGQESAKRALMIAACGGHSLLLKGPPGAGKTMLASRLPGILPGLSDQAAMQVAMIASISHQGFNSIEFSKRPFRAPHHSASSAALVGGGSPPKPGEISLAHAGVLFLDELPEFSRPVLEALREPLEAGRVMISRAEYQYQFPAQFQLVAAMNPCPCGYFGDSRNNCCCTREQVLRYQNKLSGPLLDRIDLHVDVPALSYHDLLKSRRGESNHSPIIRQQVEVVQGYQLERSQCLNAALSNSQVADVCQLNTGTQNTFSAAIEKLQISARYFHRLLKIARTIADIEQASNIAKDHLLEALSYARRNSFSSVTSQKYHKL